MARRELRDPTGMHITLSDGEFTLLRTFVEHPQRVLSRDQLLDYARLPRVISYATITAVANTIILTAMATLGALLYNVVASLVGGVRVSLMDE